MSSLTNTNCFVIHIYFPTKMIKYWKLKAYILKIKFTRRRSIVLSSRKHDHHNIAKFSETEVKHNLTNASKRNYKNNIDTDEGYSFFCNILVILRNHVLVIHFIQIVVHIFRLVCILVWTFSFLYIQPLFSFQWFSNYINKHLHLLYMKLTSECNKIKFLYHINILLLGVLQSTATKDFIYWNVILSGFNLSMIAQTPKVHMYLQLSLSTFYNSLALLWNHRANYNTV